ncbi:MAG: hypothetical protein JNK90_02800 [Planctomycetaceae bacterium]|nr:hypothetical protein [Planctomycetaceae bacterium]
MTKELAEIVLGVANLIVILCGVLWAYRRFRVERTHQPRMEFDIDCSFFGPQNGSYACQVLVRAKNCGLIRHEFRDLKIRILGIEKTDILTYWTGNEPRLQFPHKIAVGSLLYAPKYDYIFVEPGVEQTLTFNTMVPEKMSFVVIHVSFTYSEENTHSAERVFKVIERN